MAGVEGGACRGFRCARRGGKGHAGRDTRSVSTFNGRFADVLFPGENFQIIPAGSLLKLLGAWARSRPRREEVSSDYRTVSASPWVGLGSPFAPLPLRFLFMPYVGKLVLVIIQTR